MQISVKIFKCVLPYEKKKREMENRKENDNQMEWH